MPLQHRNAGFIGLSAGDLRRIDSAPFAWADALSALCLIPGVVGVWTGATPTSGGNLVDIAGNALTLTARNTPTFGRDANLLVPYVGLASIGSQYFDRADEVITSILGTETHIASGNRGLSWGGWFRSDTLGALQGLIGKDNSGGSQAGYRLVKTAGNLIEARVCSDATCAANATATTTGAVTSSTWYMAAATFYPSSSLNVFLGTADGLEKASDTTGVPASVFDNTNAFEIGRTSAGNYLNGRASLCWLSQAALLDEHIQVIFGLSKALFNI